MPGNFILDAGYVGSKGTRLIVTFEDLNRPQVIVDPRTAGLASLNARRPNQADQRSVRSERSIGSSIYRALQLKVERRMRNGLTFLADYTYSKPISSPPDIGWQVGGGSFIGAVQDVKNLRAKRSMSCFDVTQRFVQTLIYDIPFFKGTHGLTKALLDGWQASTIIFAQSGFPAPVTFGVDTRGTGVGSRPDLTGQLANLSDGDRTWKRWFNVDAFSQTPFGTVGGGVRALTTRVVQLSAKLYF